MQLCPVRTPNVERTHGSLRQPGLATVLLFVQRCLVVLLVTFASAQRVAPALCIVCDSHAQSARGAHTNERDTQAPDELHRASAPIEFDVVCAERAQYEPEPSELQGIEDDDPSLWGSFGLAHSHAWPASPVFRATAGVWPPQRLVAAARQRGPPRA